MPLSLTDFAAKVKEKYPDYSDIDDSTLVNKIVEKYPAYKDSVDLTPPPPSPPADTTAQPKPSFLDKVKGAIGGTFGPTPTPAPVQVPTGTTVTPQFQTEPAATTAQQNVRPPVVQKPVIPQTGLYGSTGEGRPAELTAAPSSLGETVPTEQGAAPPSTTAVTTPSMQPQRPAELTRDYKPRGEPLLPIMAKTAEGVYVDLDMLLATPAKAVMTAWATGTGKGGTESADKAQAVQTAYDQFFAPAKQLVALSPDQEQTIKKMGLKGTALIAATQFVAQLPLYAGGIGGTSKLIGGLVKKYGLDAVKEATPALIRLGAKDAPDITAAISNTLGLGGVSAAQEAGSEARTGPLNPAKIGAAALVGATVGAASMGVGKGLTRAATAAGGAMAATAATQPKETLAGQNVASLIFNGLMMGTMSALHGRMPESKAAVDKYRANQTPENEAAAKAAIDGELNAMQPDVKDRIEKAVQSTAKPAPQPTGPEFVPVGGEAPTPKEPVTPPAVKPVDNAPEKAYIPEQGVPPNESAAPTSKTPDASSVSTVASGETPSGSTRPDAATHDEQARKADAELQYSSEVNPDAYPSELDQQQLGHIQEAEKYLQSLPEETYTDLFRHDSKVDINTVPEQFRDDVIAERVYDKSNDLAMRQDQENKRILARNKNYDWQEHLANLHGQLFDALKNGWVDSNRVTHLGGYKGWEKEYAGLTDRPYKTFGGTARDQKGNRIQLSDNANHWLQEHAQEFYEKPTDIGPVEGADIYDESEQTRPENQDDVEALLQQSMSPKKFADWAKKNPREKEIEDDAGIKQDLADYENELRGSIGKPIGEKPPLEFTPEQTKPQRTITQTELLGDKEKAPEAVKPEEPPRETMGGEDHPVDPNLPLFKGTDAVEGSQEELMKEGQPPAEPPQEPPPEPPAAAPEGGEEPGKGKGETRLYSNPVGPIADEIKSAAKDVKAYTDKMNEETKYAGDLEKEHYQLKGKKTVDDLNAYEIIKNNKIPLKDQEGVINHIDNPSEPLTPEQQQFKDEVIEPLRDELYAVAKENMQGKPMIDKEKYLPRNAKGVGGWLDMLASGLKGAVSGGLLRKTTGSMRHRVMMAMENDLGEHRVVSVKNRGVTSWQNVDGFKIAEDMGSLNFKTQEQLLEKELAPWKARQARLENELKILQQRKGSEIRQENIRNELKDIGKQIDDIRDAVDPYELNNKVFIDKNGTQWKLIQATEKEIEHNSNVKYHKTLLLNLLVELNKQKAIQRARAYLESVKNDPRFRQTPEEGGLGAVPVAGHNMPEGYKKVTVPQLSMYYLPARVAETLNMLYQHADTGLVSKNNLFQKINDVLRNAIFFNFMIHIPNIVVHAAVNRGLSPILDPRLTKVNIWKIPLYLPRRYVDLWKTSRQAFEDVLTMNDNYKLAIEKGAGAHYANQITKNYYKLMLDAANEELKNKPALARAISKALGLANPYTFSGKFTWFVQDFCERQAIYEEMLHGKTMERAIADVGKHIPNYRIPARILNMPELSMLMQSKYGVTMFPAYHYGALRSYGEMFKSLLGKVPMKERAEALDKMAMMVVTGLIIYPMADELAKRLTGNENSKFRRAGAITFPYKLQQLLTGKIDKADFLQTVVTPSVGAQLGTEALWGRDPRTGAKISALKAVARSVAPVAVAERLGQGKISPREYAASLIGVTSPKIDIDKMTTLEKKVYDIAMSHIPQNERTKEQIQHSNEKNKLINEYKKTKNVNALNQAVKAQKITKADRTNIIKGVTQTTLEKYSERMSYAELQQFSPEDQQTIMAANPALKIKDDIKKLSELDPKDKGRAKIQEDIRKSLMERAQKVREMPQGEAKAVAIKRVKSLQTMFHRGLKGVFQDDKTEAEKSGGKQKAFSIRSNPDEN